MGPPLKSQSLLQDRWAPPGLPFTHTDVPSPECCSSAPLTLHPRLLIPQMLARPQQKYFAKRSRGAPWCSCASTFVPRCHRAVGNRARRVLPGMVSHTKPGPKAAAAVTAQTIIRLASCDLAHGAWRKLSADLGIINYFSWLEQVDVKLF